MQNLAVKINKPRAHIDSLNWVIKVKGCANLNKIQYGLHFLTIKKAKRENYLTFMKSLNLRVNKYVEIL